jgi:spectinomycin phosphotransferase
MIEKPHIRDETIISALRENYSIPVISIEFLPIGNDASAWAYRAHTENQTTYFLKVRKEISNRAGFLVPRFLQDQGIVQTLAPLPTRARELWINAEDFFLILYPFIIGIEAMQVGLSDSQWTEFGSVLKRIHFTELPSHISQSIKRETFNPKWSNLAKELHKRVGTRNYDDPYQKELAAFWKEKSEVIDTLIERAETIGKHLQQIDLEFVLCHADIHTANILITNEQEMFIVDWDDTLLAPKERDLMFVLHDDTIHTREEQLFFDGYGKVKINQLALAYYRYEWCVQEIGDFGKRVFLTKDSGESTKQDSVEGFIKLFSQDDVIETALTLNTPVEIVIRDNS